MNSESQTDEKQITTSLQENTSTLTTNTTLSDLNQLEENESILIQLLTYWLPKTAKGSESTAVPKNREELIDFINKLFESFKKEEQECWSQLNNLHLMTPQMLYLYQKKFIQVQSMNWIQLMCYKIISCPNGKECRSYREQKMLNNQFYDFELECPYFHNSKDKRRIVLPLKPDEEFKYKGKYQEQNVGEDASESMYSHNYFESVYHPLFYKFFDCKRLQCKGSIYCPMKHSEEERVAWEEEFSLFWRKDRSIYYPKKKKNDSDVSEYGPGDGQFTPQSKSYRYNGYNQQGNFQSNRFNSQPMQQNQFNYYGNNGGNRGKYQQKPRDGYYQKDNRFNKHPYEQQPFYPQMYGQGMDIPAETKYQNSYSPVLNNGQYFGDLNTGNLKLKQSNSTPVSYDPVESQFTNFTGYSNYNQMYNYPPMQYNSSPMMNKQASTPSKKNYLNSPIGVGFQDSDDDCDFESIFSSNTQYSQSFTPTPTEGLEKKQLNPSNSKAFYPENGKSRQSNRIEVK